MAINKGKEIRFICPGVGEDGELGMHSRPRMCIKAAVLPSHGELDPRSVTLLRWGEDSTMQRPLLFGGPVGPVSLHDWRVRQMHMHPASRVLQ